MLWGIISLRTTNHDQVKQVTPSSPSVDSVRSSYHTSRVYRGADYWVYSAPAKLESVL